MINLMWRLIYIVSVCCLLSRPYIRRSQADIHPHTYPGRTGRFGRKGISINFVHNQHTWSQMDQIEKALGRQIVRIETNDLDEMEEVSVIHFLPRDIVVLMVFGVV